MIDGIIKADGTSRLMQAELPVTYEEFRTQCRAGTQPLDVLFNALGWSQLPTFLNKLNLLKDDTAALFGLGADAVPDDVFSWLGKYNQHWWKRVPTSWVTSLADLYDTKDYFIQRSGSKTTSRTVSYSSGIVVDNNGNVSLASPISTVSVSYNTYSNANVLKGNYVDGLVDGNSNVVTGIYYVPSDTSNAQQSGYYGVSMGTQKVKTTLVEGGDVEFMYSGDPSAYPNGIAGGFRYSYLGVPFSNFQLVSKVATGSYEGTNTFGASNPTVVTVGFDAKLVVVVNTSDTTLGFGIIVNEGDGTGTGLFTHNGSWFMNRDCQFLNGIVSWYSTASYNQLNYSGRTYSYVAIG